MKEPIEKISKRTFTNIRLDKIIKLLGMLAVSGGESITTKIKMLGIAGLSPKEIAGIMDVSQKTVKQLLGLMPTNYELARQKLGKKKKISVADLKRLKSK